MNYIPLWPRLKPLPFLYTDLWRGLLNPVKGQFLNKKGDNTEMDGTDLNRKTSFLQPWFHSFYKHVL